MEPAPLRLPLVLCEQFQQLFVGAIRRRPIWRAAAFGDQTICGSGGGAGSGTLRDQFNRNDQSDESRR